MFKMAFYICVSGALFLPSLATAQDAGAHEPDASTAAALCSTGHQLDFVGYAEDYLEEGLSERAIDVLNNGCDRGDAASCRRLADLYAAGTGVEADARRAEQLRKRASELEE